jgi:hypothetical protein
MRVNSLTCNSVTDAHMGRILSALTQLTSLRLHYCEKLCTLSWLDTPSFATRLTHLSLADCFLPVVEILHLRRLRSLRSFELQRAFVDEIDQPTLAAFNCRAQAFDRERFPHLTWFYYLNTIEDRARCTWRATTQQVSTHTQWHRLDPIRRFTASTPLEVCIRRSLWPSRRRCRKYRVRCNSHRPIDRFRVFVHPRLSQLHRRIRLSSPHHQLPQPPPPLMPPHLPLHPRSNRTKSSSCSSTTIYRHSHVTYVRWFARVTYRSRT